MAAPSTLTQLVRFTQDMAGLDRTFRMAQAAAIVLVHCPLPQGLFLQLVSALSPSTSKAPEPAAVMTIVSQVGQRIDVARRFSRLFAFLACFHSAWAAMYPTNPSPSPPPPADGPADGEKASSAASKTPSPTPALPPKPCVTSLERWLAASSHSFTGMYLLLETATFPDALGVPGLRVLSPALEHRLFVEAMRLWFLGLGCGVALGLARLLGTLTRTPLPPLPEEDAVAEGQQATATAAAGEGEGQSDDWIRERDRLRRVTQRQRQRRRLWRREVFARSRHMARRTAADLLDMAIAGSVVGWVSVGQGTVGVVMLVTSWLIGQEVWERCGADLAAGR